MPKFRTVPFDLLDRPRNIRFDVNALADLEEKLGIGPAQIFSEERTGYATIRGLLWAGIKWEDKRITVDRAGELLQTFLEKGGELEKLMMPLAEALTNSGIFPREEEIPESKNEEAGGTTKENPSVPSENG